MIALIIGGVIAVAAVVVVALPFLRDTGEPELLDQAESQERFALLEARDRAVGALKELEFDHQTGKVDDVDYRQLVGPLRRSIAEALQALDGRERSKPVPANTPAPPVAVAEPSLAAAETGSAEDRVPDEEDVQRDD